MFLQYLLTCIVLGPFHSQAKVVDSFTECKNIFYKGKEPQGMDEEAKKICQIRDGINADFATLYSVDHRIPLYSAYILDDQSLNKQTNKDQCSVWHIEPQLVSRAEPASMMTESKYTSSDRNKKDALKRNQAISEDYIDTGYDRGHLYPNSFDYNDQFKVTYTLTNAAPMDPCFNRVYWKKLEGDLQRFLKSKLEEDVTVYIITGAVPGNVRISDCGDSRDAERVTVPSHIWTAVCYKHKIEDTKSFSFGYIADNDHVRNINLMSISDMNQQLGVLYRKSSQIQIFDNDCCSAKTMVAEIWGQMKSTQIKIPEKFDVAQNTLDTVKRLRNTDSEMSTDGEIHPRQRGEGRLDKLTAILSFDSSDSYFTSQEVLKGEDRSACIITSAKKRHWTDRSEIRKRDVSEGSEAIRCQLVPEKSVDGKTAADGSQCSNFKYNNNRCTCSTEKGKEKFCCSSPCLYQSTLKGYRCNSGQSQIECSPQYSLLAIKGKRCLDDHPCATYGEDYYWCYTDIGQLTTDWEYCSPPLLGSKAKDGKYCRSDHACAGYGSEPWCFTDDDENWNYCCTSDDCFSAVNYKTCKPDHPCGYYGKNYLWCSTTDDSWNYCCKACRQ
ncbi:uncharacterized protein LOC130434499 [Triplophysa dalaica]|uniref:uncharacterized protein LOC130434499 n=1 Tax=Triplophysa dalaica TaxID=1582913 RepID=UPI0024DF4E30|nr:uncharacterized protein LOC130434499 [Triplophysa dalaica]